MVTSVPELEKISRVNQVIVLRQIIETMDRTWFRDVLKDIGVPGRTAIYNAFRSPGYYGLSWQDWYNLPQEQRQQRIDLYTQNQTKAIVKILNTSDWKDWVIAYCRDTNSEQLNLTIEQCTTIRKYQMHMEAKRNEGQLVDISARLNDLNAELRDMARSDPDFILEERAGDEAYYRDY